MSTVVAEPRARGLLLWCRAGLLSCVVLLAGALAHVAADGSLPGAPVLAGLLATGAAVAAPLLRFEASRSRVVLLLVLGQAAVHTVLTALTGHGDDPVPAGFSGEPEWLVHLVADVSGPHALMAVGHAGAAALVGLWLAAGERTAWAVARHAARALARRSPTLPPLPAPAPPRPPATSGERSRPPRMDLVLAQPRRGPPPYPGRLTDTGRDEGSIHAQEAGSTGRPGGDRTRPHGLFRQHEQLRRLEPDRERVR